MSYQANLLENTFPKSLGEDTEEKLRRIHSYLYQLNEQLRYIFNNLEAENFNETELQSLKKQFVGQLEVMVTDLAGNYTAIRQNVDGITSTVNAVSGEVSSVKQTIDGLQVQTSGGTTYISGSHIKSGTIEGAVFSCVLTAGASVSEGDIRFYYVNGASKKQAGYLAVDDRGAGSGSEAAKRVLLRTLSEFGLKLSAENNISVESDEGSIYVNASGSGGQLVLGAGNHVRVQAPGGSQYVFRSDGIYYGGTKIAGV